LIFKRAVGNNIPQNIYPIMNIHGFQDPWPV